LSKSKLPVRQEGYSGFGNHNTARGVVKANHAPKNNIHSAAKRRLNSLLLKHQMLERRIRFREGFPRLLEFTDKEISAQEA